MKNTGTNTTSNTRLIVLFAMLLLSSVGMFGQNVETASPAVANIEMTATASTTAAVEANPNLNMVSWFMGTKQTPKAAISTDGGVNKKQMINSGIAPNRLLIKAFLKKANDFQSSVA